jgi:hypothetical protein
VRRYVISPVIGAGTVQDPYRVSVQDVEGANSVAVVPVHTSGPNEGEPKYTAALGLVAAVNITPILNVTNVYVFPDYPLDAQLSGMESGARAAMVQSVEAYDLDGQGLHFDADHADEDSLRALLIQLGQQIEPAFNLDAMGVPEVSE